MEGVSFASASACAFAPCVAPATIPLFEAVAQVLESYRAEAPHPVLDTAAIRLPQGHFGSFHRVRVSPAAKFAQSRLFTFPPHWLRPQYSNPEMP